MMSTKTLYRLSGGVLLAGGLLMAIGVVGVPFIIGGSADLPSAAASLPFLLVSLVIVCGLVLIVAGLPGMYVRQAMRTGGLGVFGFVLTMCGLLLDLGVALIFATVFPWLARTAPQVLNFANGGPLALLLLLYGAFLLLGVGSLVLGIATTQAGVLPRGVGVVLIVSGVANLVSIPVWPLGVIGFIGQFFFAAGLAWVGYALVLRQGEEAVQPSLPLSKVRSTKVGG